MKLKFRIGEDSFVATPQEVAARFGLDITDLDLECEWAAKHNELVDIPAQPGLTVELCEKEGPQ